MHGIRTVSRRQFIGATLAAVGSGVAVAGVARLAAAAPVGIRTLHDQRFPASLRAAHRLASASTLECVGGDATDLALWLRAQPAATGTPRLQGVTTHSIPFCLSQMNPGRKLRLERLDRDLYFWQI